MEQEAFFSGYCRSIDNSRMVTVEAEDKKLLDVSCDYPNCAYAPNCSVAKKIDEFLKNA